MRRLTLRSRANCLLLALFILPLALTPPADAARGDKREPLDLSILGQRDALIPQMTTAQRLQYLELERGIEQAQSDKRSGEYLANSKPPALEPDRDVKPLVERGKKLIAQAEAAIYENQRRMIQLLKSVEAEKAAQAAVDLTKYDYALPTASLESALDEQARELMEACWELGYETLFFDGIFIRDGEGLRRADTGIRNQVYDALVKIDGDTFSLTIPVDFQLKPGTRGNSRHVFSYQNAAVFENDKKALLVLELTTPASSATGLLSLRAIDLETQRIAAQRLVKIDDLAALFELPPEGLADRLPTDVRFRDPGQRIEIFARLSNPYAFQLTHAPGTGVATACLAETLLRHSGLRIVDSAFLLEAYGETLEDPGSWVGQANARLSLEPAEEDGSYRVTAQARDSDRILAIGTLGLTYPDVPEIPEAPPETEAIEAEME